jgi:hypothetical protein
MFSSDEELVEIAQSWGFRCIANEQGHWCITPVTGSESWTLVRRGDRWLLLVDAVPQISFYGEDVLRFLERRRGS